MAKSKRVRNEPNDEPRTVVKEVPYAKLYSDGTIFLGGEEGLRCSYPHVLTKYKGDDDDAKAKHSIVLLIPKKKKFRPARELITEVINGLMKENRVKNLKADNKFLRDGDLSAKEENEGNWTVNASESKKVIVRDNKRDPKTGKPRVLKPREDDDRIYGGCFVNALIRPWFMNNKYGKKVNAGLVAVQFMKDGEPFGQGRIPEDEVDAEMDNYAEDDEDYDDDDDDDDDDRPKSKRRQDDDDL
jgi:hypothetical protein